MVTLVITICLLITPFIMAFSHCAIIYNKHSASVYTNYFIVFSISSFALMNAIAYLTDGDSVAQFQGWNFSPAVFQIGLFELSLFIFSIFAVFKNKSFKAGFLLFFAIYTVMSSFTLFSGSKLEDGLLGMFIVENVSAFIAYVFYKALYQK